MDPMRLVPNLFRKLVLPASLFLCLPYAGRAQMATTATYTANSGSNNVTQKVIAVGTDGYTRFIVQEAGGPPAYEPQLTYVRCLDVACDSYNTKSWPIENLSPFTYSLAIGPDGYARIAYEIYRFVYDSAGEYHYATLGFIQCFDDDCGSSTNDSFVDYAAVGNFAAVAVGSDGTAYITYDNGNPDDGPQGIGLATCNSGGCSTSTLVANISVFDLTDATIAIGSDGNPVVAYADDQFSSDGYFTFVSSTGHYYEDGTDTVITSDASLSDLSIGPDGFARIYIQNQAYWNSAATPGAYFVECGNTSCSSAAVNPISISGASSASHGSLAIGADGNARVEVDLGQGDSTYYVECTAADCSTYGSSIISADSGDSDGLASIVSDPNGLPRMIVQDENYVVYHVRPLVPKSLGVLSDTKTISLSYFPGGICNDSLYGINGAIHYQVFDQDGNSLALSTMEPQEQVLNLVYGGIPRGDPHPGWGDIGPSAYPGTAQYTDSNGKFWDAPFGSCATTEYNLTETQNISVLLRGVRYNVRSNSWIEGSSAAGHGSETNSVDISLSR